MYKSNLFYFEYFKTIRLAIIIRLPPIIVNMDIDFRIIIFKIVAVTGSIYDRIIIFPPLSFLVPILYNKKANAVGNNHKITAIIKSENVNIIKSHIVIGKNMNTMNKVGHHAKNVSKSPCALNWCSELLRIL